MPAEGMLTGEPRGAGTEFWGNPCVVLALGMHAASQADRRGVSKPQCRSALVMLLCKGLARLLLSGNAGDSGCCRSPTKPCDSDRVHGAAAQEACDNLLAKGILPHASPALCGAGAGLGVADLLFWIAWWLPF